MEGIFSFFLESAFLGLFLYGEKRLGRIGHWWAGFLVFLGSWISGFFIVVTDAWMQHPVAFTRLPDGSFSVDSFWGLLANPWALIQYAHTMSGALVTGSFVMTALGAYYLLAGQFPDFGRISVRVGIIAALIASAAQVFPTGDIHGRYLAQNQPVTTAAMEGLFHTEAGAPLVILGQPDVENERIENPFVVNRALSFLTYGTPDAEVSGLDEYPKDQWPSSIPLLYFSYHIMAGLGTIFVLVALAGAVLLYRRRLYHSTAMLWILMLCAPLPYVANTAGWVAAETGRQPWLIYGLMRTSEGYSNNVHAGSTLFTLLGFMGLYLLLGILFLFLVGREIEHGPRPPDPASVPSGVPLATV